MNVKQEIARNVAYLRKQCGFTQGKLADFISVQRSTIASWETGVSGIDADSLYHIAKALGVSIRELYGEYALADTNDLSTREKEMLTIFRSLSERDKNIVLSLLNAMKT